jgi:5-methyltetrahydrofolate--homocysteine methyltransferase
VVIVGELINTSRKAVGEAVKSRDAAAIQDLARRQAAAGADYIDVNAGTLVGEEKEALSWLVRTVQSAVDKPCCIDSADAGAVAASLEVHRGKAIINSVTMEKNRFAAMSLLPAKYGARIIGLCMDDKGIPVDAGYRFEVANQLVEELTSTGVARDDIFLDPLVQPISTGTDNGLVVLDTIRAIRDQLPGVHVICGLSNVSYGLPNRKLLNTAFLVLAMAAGLDGAILNPLDAEQMAYLTATRSLLGQDRFCRAYLTAHRQGRLGGDAAKGSK